MADSYLGLVAAEVMAEMAQTAALTPPGCIVEVGVYQGGTAVELAKVCIEQGRELFLYDTFTGIPLKGPYDAHGIGDFADTNVNAVRKLIPLARVIPGVFPFTIVDMAPVAFAHIDCDQYDSIRMAIYVLGPMMAAGGIMWFDDVGCLEGADRAVYQHKWKYPLETASCGKVFARF